MNDDARAAPRWGQSDEFQRLGAVIRLFAPPFADAARVYRCPRRPNRSEQYFGLDRPADPLLASPGRWLTARQSRQARRSRQIVAPALIGLPVGFTGRFENGDRPISAVHCWTSRADAGRGVGEPGGRATAHRRQQRGQPRCDRDLAGDPTATAGARTGHRLQRTRHHRAGRSDASPVRRSIDDVPRPKRGHGDRRIRLRPGGGDRKAGGQPHSRCVSLCRRQAQQAGKRGHDADAFGDDRGSAAAWCSSTWPRAASWK